MTRKEFDALPLSVEVREVRVRVDCPGFRPKEMVIATTLLDAEAFTAKDIAELYFKRWNADISHPHCTSSDHLYPERRAA
jgi:putative transposase